MTARAGDAGVPYWRLSGFYFFYFATVGALIPYFGLYLASLGFGAPDIGALMALILVARIVAPYVWGFLVDHRGRRMAAVRLAALLTLACFLGVFAARAFWSLGAVLLAFGFFWNASLPVLEAATLSHLGPRLAAYGRVRLWGSIGFIVSVAAIGPVLDRFGTAWLLPIVAALLGGILLFSVLAPEGEAVGRAARPAPILRVLRRREVLVFFGACFLMQLSHGPYYTFYSIYLASLGYSKTAIGALWAFAVVCEIGVFLAMPRLLAHVSVRTILLASFLLASLRWLLIGEWAALVTVAVAAQALHAASFGAFHASAMQIVHRFFTGRHQHRGQAIYSSVSFGLGGAAGSFYSGLTWSAWGAAPTFLVGSLAALGAFALTAWGFRRAI